MSRRRSLKLLTALAAASLVVAACSGDDDDDAVIGRHDRGAGGTEPAGRPRARRGRTRPPPRHRVDRGHRDDRETETDETTAALPGAEDVGVEGGSGCGIPHGPYEEPGEPAGEVRVAWNDPLLSFNRPVDSRQRASPTPTRST